MSPTEPQVQLCLLSTNPEATLALGQCVGQRLFEGAVLALEGEMGSGKTTLVRGLALGLGIEGPVTSPTFALMQEHHGRLDLWHFDAWMAAREEAFLEAGGADILGAEGVAVVEWAENVSAWLPRPRLRVQLEVFALDEGGARGGARPGAGPRSEIGPPQERALTLSLIHGPEEQKDLENRLQALLEDVHRAARGIPGLKPLDRGPESTLFVPDS